MRLVVIDIQISFNTDTFPVIIEYDLVGVIVPLFSTTLIAILVFGIHYSINLHLLFGLVAIGSQVRCGFSQRPLDNFQNVLHLFTKAIFEFLYNLEQCQRSGIPM